MYLTVKQQLKHLSKDEYLELKELCHIGKNLVNEAIYSIRQHYFDTKKYLAYIDNYKALKDSENYKLLNSNMAQQLLKEVDGSFKSFFSLLKLSKKREYDQQKCKLPKYLPKDGYTTLIIGFIRLNGDKLIVPLSNKYRKDHKPIEIKIPPILVNKTIKEIRIIPKADARFFEIQYTYETQCIQRNLNTNNALAIDLGIDNLATCVTNTGRSFIINGKGLKNINQWYNKENARLQSIKDKQKINTSTNRQKDLAKRRNNKVNDYMSKAASMIIKYCIQNNIGTLVVGYNEDFQRNSNIGKKNNQNFVNIPLGRLIDKLKYLCELNGIVFVMQEESYTSKASFFDRDEIPTYKKDDKNEYTFSGKRIYRGLYKTKNGTLINADVNGALNILCKSKVVNMDVLYQRGVVDTPLRIRVS